MCICSEGGFIILCYKSNQCFLHFLDATKAFDRINYCKLFRLLLKRDFPACILQVLLCFYTNNFVRVSWCGLFSEYFLAMNGVKQGGVLSPVLFCVYIDDLLVSLRTRTSVVSLAATMWVLSLMRTTWYCLLPLLLRYARC